MAEQHAYHPNQELHQHVHESKLSAVYTKISSLSYQQGEVSVTKKTESNVSNLQQWCIKKSKSQGSNMDLLFTCLS